MLHDIGWHAALWQSVIPILLVAIALLAFAAAPSGDRPRVIQMNDDSVMYYQYCIVERPTAADLERMVDIFARAGVDTLTHCVYLRTLAYYDSKVVEVAGDLTPEAVKPWQCGHYWHWHATLRRLIADGSDPPRVIAALCHERGMRFLPSFRLNDLHGIHPHEGNYGSFRRDHPEWVFNEKAMDYAVPQVRKHVLSVARELADNYEIDGLDLDFMRWPVYFKNDQVVANTPVMTEFIRQVRAILDEAAKRLNRRMLLSVRVPLRIGEGKVINAGTGSADLECLGVGLDVNTWVREQLVDMVCPMNFFYTDWGNMVTNLKAWRDLTEGTECGVYPTIHTRALEGYDSPYISQASYRGAAYSYYLGGATGIALYNLWHDSKTAWQAVPDFADPDVLGAKPRRYHGYLGEIMLINKGEGKTFNVHVPEDPQIAAGRAHLRFLGANLTLDHVIDVTVNGTVIDPATLSYERVRPGGIPGGMQTPYGNLVSFPLRGTGARQGMNELTIQLKQINPELPYLPTYIGIPENKGGIAVAMIDTLFGYSQVPPRPKPMRVATWNEKYWED